MATQSTKIYKRSFKGSVGAGAGALFGNTGKSYYILEHKTATRYHKVGETLEIIVNQIEIGRDPSCQIRYDESCQTVSRRHAAIVRDGDGWKLIQLSSTNSTLLNGERIQKEWYLRNGDEIQLSTGGPRLGFIVPVGKQASVGSIGLSRRLSLFRQQAMRPYRNALMIMSICLVAAIAGGGWALFRQSEQHEIEIRSFEQLVEDTNREIVGVKKQGEREKADFQRQIDSLRVANPVANDLQALVDSCKNDVYFLKVDEVYLTNEKKKMQILCENGDGGKKIPFAWTGTGFLLEDGKFVTARHCVQGWRFELDKYVMEAASYVDSRGGEYRLEATVKAQNKKGETFTFNASDFIYNDFYDDKYLYKYPNGKQMEYSDGTPIGVINALYTLSKGEKRIWSTDWTYIQTGMKGKLKIDAQLSTGLKAGTELHVLGFPRGIGSKDVPGNVEPPYNRFTVASDGLDNSLCFLHTRGVDHGNSGGPIFALKDNELVVVGIVSRGSKSDEYAFGVPIANIYSKLQ